MLDAFWWTITSRGISKMYSGTKPIAVLIVVLATISFSGIITTVEGLYKTLQHNKTGQDTEPVVVYDNKGIPMVYIPEGVFNMGLDFNEAIEICKDLVPDRYVLSYCDESARREFDSITSLQTVTVLSFYIDQFETTLADYLNCVDADVCDTTFLTQEMEAITSGDQLPMDVPVNGADYYDAAIYCAWRGGRLPTEAEWEYAARGPESNYFPWGNNFDGTRLNFCDEECGFRFHTEWNDGYRFEAPIGSIESGQSWAGVYDLAGNVAEWTSTRGAYNYVLSIYSRVIKGGSYESFAVETASWSRLLSGEFTNLPTIGFRCARTTQP